MAPMIILLLYQSWQNSREGLWQPEQAVPARSPPVQVPAAAQVQAPLHPLKAAWPSLQLQQQGRALREELHVGGSLGCLAQPTPAPTAAEEGTQGSSMWVGAWEPQLSSRGGHSGGSRPGSRLGYRRHQAPAAARTAGGSWRFTLPFAAAAATARRVLSFSADRAWLGSIAEEAFAQPVMPGQHATATAVAGRRKDRFRSLQCQLKPGPASTCGRSSGSSSRRLSAQLEMPA